MKLFKQITEDHLIAIQIPETVHKHFEFTYEVSMTAILIKQRVCNPHGQYFYMQLLSEMAYHHASFVKISYS